MNIKLRLKIFIRSIVAGAENDNYLYMYSFIKAIMTLFGIPEIKKNNTPGLQAQKHANRDYD